MEITLDRVVPESADVTWETKWVPANATVVTDEKKMKGIQTFNENLPVQPQAVLTMKRSPKIPLAAMILCKECAVKLKSDDRSWPQRWSLTKVIIHGWSISECDT